MDELMPLGAFKWNETSQSYYVWDNLYLYQVWIRMHCAYGILWFALYVQHNTQAEVLVIEAASPWMETFCILYKGPHQACDQVYMSTRAYHTTKCVHPHNTSSPLFTTQAWQLDKNARVYGVDGYNGLVG